ncbi:hypothetical protein GCM10023084_73500 [Streptomyces lacrimifluminis]|uniref:Uncharacterized protein n=1 Tax=Streptomyces lacrimifluminis TaxID=1500077 RepID=A0A917P6E7_9ACTN|nr:hypothetical protein [Streptomyces lacrimifluminis]GGJ64030.1 hypothetical protein GCM10012282_71580 [Streptomyces lacrimifluminis]
MAIDPYAVLRALLRAEAARNAPKPQVPRVKEAQPQRPPKEPGR